MLARETQEQSLLATMQVNLLALNSDCAFRKVTQLQKNNVNPR